MPRNVRLIQVFVASPSDLMDERRAVQEAIDEVNRALASQDVRLEFLGWETHVDPGSGQYPQDVINRQIGDKYDIFLGIMWTRFGTPTAGAGSGTEEELQRAFDRLQREGGVEIKFYFKDKDAPISSLDLDQLKRVREFRSGFGAAFNAYHSTFRELPEFERLIRLDLQRFAHRIASGTEVSVAPIKAVTDSEIGEDILRNLSAALKEIDSEGSGLIDSMEEANAAMNSIGKVVTRISANIQRFNESITTAGRQMTALNTLGVKPDPQTARLLIDNVTLRMNEFVTALTEDTLEYHKYYRDFAEAYSSFVDFIESNRDAMNVPDGFSEQAEGLEFYARSVETGIPQMQGFIGALKSLPNMSREFNKARRKAVAIMEDFLSVLASSVERASKLAGDIKRFV